MIEEGQIIVNGSIVGGMIGQRGAQGIGIANIEKTSTSGLIDTYTITYTNGDTDTFIVTNGEKGDKGDPGAIKIIIVAELPQTGADDTIYLVPLENPTEEGNNYAEYIYINGQWELLGKIGVHVDLTDYVKNTDYASDSVGGVIKSASGFQTQIDAYGRLNAKVVPYSSYSGVTSGAFISKGTLDNVITGKGLVKNTDYANGSTGGVFKTSSGYGTEVNVSGYLRGLTKDYATYSSGDNATIISKGTLENVLTNRIGAIDDVLDAINGEVI